MKGVKEHLDWKTEDCNYSKKSWESLCGVASFSFPCGSAQPELSLMHVRLVCTTRLGLAPGSRLPPQLASQTSSFVLMSTSYAKI